MSLVKTTRKGLRPINTGNPEFYRRADAEAGPAATMTGSRELTAHCFGILNSFIVTQAVIRLAEFESRFSAS